MRVLIVEDEPLLADTLTVGLRRENIAVDVALDGQSGLSLALVNDYDVVVLDRDLPQMHGDDVCIAMSESASSARILMLTAAGATDDKVDGLSLGADDYLSKPFAFDELVARIRALARRTAPAVAPVLERGALRLDPGKHLAWSNGQPVSLSRKEFGLLEELLRADGNVVSTERLLEKVWDENADPFTNVVRVTMMTLRRKLGGAALIQTVHGSGYRVP